MQGKKIKVECIGVGLNEMVQYRSELGHHIFWQTSVCVSGDHPTSIIRPEDGNDMSHHNFVNHISG